MHVKGSDDYGHKIKALCDVINAMDSKISNIEDRLDGLDTSVSALESVQVVEDYFFVNEAAFTSVNGETCFDPFSVAKG